MMAGIADRVRFDTEDALFDSVPYRPWHSPLGTEPAGVDPGDRRIIGRLDGEPVSVTDLPPHIVHRSDPPGYAHHHQYLERGRDFLDWVANTAAGTRFLGTGLGWDAEVKIAVATAAVRAALEWDAEGNILVMNPPGYTTPLTGGFETRRYRLRPTADGRWEVLADHDSTGPALAGADLRLALDSPLNDVCCDGDPFSFRIEVA